MEMTKNQHTALLRAYVSRMNASDLQAIASKAQICLQMSMNGNNAAQLDADNQLEDAIRNAIENISELDVNRVEGVISRYTPPKIIPNGYWLVWSNEHQAWWPKSRSGYVRDEKQAGRFNLDEALDICKKAEPGSKNGIPNEIPVPAPELALYLKDGRPGDEIMAEAMAITSFESSDKDNLNLILFAFRQIAGLYVPDVVFDGYRVYQEIRHTKPGRTSPENVADVLDAVARLMKKDAGQ